MSSSRWTTERARRWQHDVGWLVGCNFTPSTAGNQLEMWQAESFDLPTIERELGWAAGLGMNVVRVYLHDLVFGEDPAGFLERFDTFLRVADDVGISAMPVLLDGVWRPRPALGPQPEPIPHRHNSIWVQSPGRPILDDPTRWHELEPYVTGVIAAHAHDERIVAWDLFNEPDQLDRDTLATDSRDAKAASAVGLLDRVFDWTAAVDPNQPLTAGVWEYGPDHRVVGNDINALILERSDIVTFHCYEPRATLEAVIAGLADHGRPMVCTEWLARTAGSTADLLEVFADAGVGAINWGLVDGRTQTRFPWRSWWESVDDDEPWFHELLHADGRPYDDAEAELFRSLTSSRR